MAVATLKSLHAYLRLLENPSELKRKMPDYSNPRTIKEGLSEMSRLVGLDQASFNDPQNIAAVIGPQRFIMIGGEPSIAAHVARIFDSSRVLVTVLIDSRHFEKATVAQSGSSFGSAPKQTAANSLSPMAVLAALEDWAVSEGAPIAAAQNNPATTTTGIACLGMPGSLIPNPRIPNPDQRAHSGRARCDDARARRTGPADRRAS